MKAPIDALATYTAPLEAEIARMRDWIFDEHGYSATCDWGDCERPTVALRYSYADDRWLCVCAQDYGDAAEEDRFFLGAVDDTSTAGSGD